MRIKKDHISLKDHPSWTLIKSPYSLQHSMNSHKNSKNGLIKIISTTYKRNKLIIKIKMIIIN